MNLDPADSMKCENPPGAMLHSFHNDMSYKQKARALLANMRTRELRLSEEEALWLEEVLESRKPARRSR